MAGRAVVCLAVAAFAAALGHLTWHALLAPRAVSGSYFVSADGAALRGPDPAEKQLYLRRTVYLSQPPRHAWIQVLGRDLIQLYVNGHMLQTRRLDSFPVAIVQDIAPYLRTGRNVIAITARQSSIDLPPILAVQGAYTLSDGIHPLQSDTFWRCSAAFERSHAWWFATEFDDNHWPLAEVVSSSLRAGVNFPPRAVTEVSLGRWITPPTLVGASATVRRPFEVAGRPRQAWVRITATSSYRLAVNGILLDQQEDQLGTDSLAPPIQRIYDITAAVQRGHNVVSLGLTGSTSVPHLLVDGEVQDELGQCYRFDSSEKWRACAGLPVGWLDPEPAPAAPWQPCQVESGDLLIRPCEPQRQIVAASLPARVIVRRAAAEIGLMAMLALGTVLACRWAANRVRALRQRAHETGRPVGEKIVYVALGPATLAIAGGILATYDPRIDPGLIYRSQWVVLAFVSVLLQWWLLMFLARRPASIHLDPSAIGRCLPRLLTWGILIGLVAAGFWLRVRHLTAEPLYRDEVENYRATRGFLQRGLPSWQGRDLPVEFVHTSELQFTANALVALVYDDDRYVVRFPGVCFSTLTILLLYVTGRRMFGPLAGLLAAAIHTFAPVCIAMSTLGRYFAHLQFMTLLSVYCYWLTLRGSGPLGHRALLLATLSFMGMYLTWEGSAFVALGMIAAALVQRCRSLRTVLGNLYVWGAMLAVLLVIVLQYSHLTLQQTQFIWYGTSLSDLSLRPMWRYQVYQPWVFLWEANWNRDALLPLLGLLGAGLLAIRSGLRRPIRFLLLIHVVTCLLMSLLLPSTSWRYIHHLIPLAILLSATAAATALRGLGRLAQAPGQAGAWGASYARGVIASLAVLLVALGSGITVELANLPTFRAEAYAVGVFKYSNLGGPVSYLRDHLQEGDVVLAYDPFQIKHLLGSAGQSDSYRFYWPVATALYIPAALNDRESLPGDRRDGTPMVESLARLEDLFARNPRVWFVLALDRQEQNHGEVNAYLRQHMEVVYEDFESVVLFRGSRHWPAFLRARENQALRHAQMREAQAGYLP